MGSMIGKTQWVLEQASTFSVEYDRLFSASLWMAVFFTVLIFVGVLVLSLKYHRRPSRMKSEAVHGHTGLEIFWSVVPLVITLILFFWGAVLFYHAYRIPANTMDIYVIGKQWMWKFQHPNGKREINDLHVPVDQPVKLTLTSQDVIHSFYVPAFRVKMDALPGRYTSLWFEATKVGEYHLFCAEFCGTEHSRMTGTVVVMEQEDYKEWLGEKIEILVGEGEAFAAEIPEFPRGKKLFNKLKCQTCHSGGTLVKLGPRLEGLFGTEVQLRSGETVLFDENYIRESILDPMAKVTAGYAPLMPTYKDQITEEEIIDIVQYVKTLSQESK